MKRSVQDLFSSPGFMLHTFASEPGRLGDPDNTPSTSGSTPPPHGLDIVKLTQAYNALLQVGSLLMHATPINGMCWLQMQASCITAPLKLQDYGTSSNSCSARGCKPEAAPAAALRSRLQITLQATLQLKLACKAGSKVAGNRADMRHQLDCAVLAAMTWPQLCPCRFCRLGLAGICTDLRCLLVC